MLTTCRNLCHFAAGFASHRNRQVSELAGKQSAVASHVSLNGALHASIRIVTPRAPHQPRATLMAAMRAVRPLWLLCCETASVGSPCKGRVAGVGASPA